MNLKKIIFILLGTLSLTAGIIGIFLPVLPTTPFLLLTAALYIRGSDRLYNKLINNRFLGTYIKRYRERNGMTRWQKTYALIIMWAMILFSFYMLENLALRIILLAIAITGTVVMGFIINTAEE